VFFFIALRYISVTSFYTFYVQYSVHHGSIYQISDKLSFYTLTYLRKINWERIINSVVKGMKSKLSSEAGSVERMLVHIIILWTVSYGRMIY
jgi:hypothetical protein